MRRGLLTALGTLGLVAGAAAVGAERDGGVAAAPTEVEGAPTDALARLLAAQQGGPARATSGGVTSAPARRGPPLPPLQPLVDAAPEGSVLLVPPGHYAGPVTVAKRLTLDGHGQATVDGQGHGTVVVVTAKGVVLTGLHVTGSGESNDQLDAAISVEADDVTVASCTIDEVLFGVLVKGANRALVCGNVISSHEDEPGMRGDGVRVWNGTGALVYGNDVVHARDVSLANAPNNSLVHNRIRGGRYGLQLVFSPGTRVEDNVLEHNLTGIAVLYSNDAVVRGNRVRHTHGPAGAALVFKESSHGQVAGNELVHNVIGVKANSPTSPDNIIVFERNHLAHNLAALDFYGENGGHVLHGNRFERNLVQVTTSGPMTARGYDWKDNAWDDYEGFDRDGDGVGDTPHEVYAFADRIFMETPAATFFRNSPAFELIDFLERLAPFATPELTLRDPTPSMAPAPAATPEPPFVPACPAGGPTSALSPPGPGTPLPAGPAARR